MQRKRWEAKRDWVTMWVTDIVGSWDSHASKKKTVLFTASKSDLNSRQGLIYGHYVYRNCWDITRFQKSITDTHTNHKPPTYTPLYVNRLWWCTICSYHHSVQYVIIIVVYNKLFYHNFQCMLLLSQCIICYYHHSVQYFIIIKVYKMLLLSQLTICYYQHIMQYFTIIKVSIMLSLS